MSEKLKIFCGECRQKIDVTELLAFSTFNCPRCGAEMRVPARFGRYLLEKRIGEEEKYLYYLASDTVLERRLAFCALKKQYGNPDEKEAMTRSGKVMALFNHPYILPIYDQGEEKNRFYRTFKHMPGGRLDWLIKEKMLPSVAILCGLLADIGEALIEVKRAGVVHHSVSPGSMLFDRAGKVRLGNFEFAEKPDDPKLALTEKSKSAFRNFTYSSPEWIAKRQESFAGDAYSYALSCYHLLSGKFPFKESSSPEKMHAERAKTKISPLPKKHGAYKLDAALVGQVMQLLSTEPEKRGEIDALVGSFRNLSTKLGYKVPFRSHFSGSTDFPE